MDEQAAIMGDWGLQSPKSFVPSFLKEDDQFSFGRMQQMADEDKDAKQGDFSFDNEKIMSSLPEFKSSSRGGLAARIAARAGFNAPRLNTESIRSKNDRSSTDEVKSPYLTITPGISPTALLDSPVFIANSQVSPTTGKFRIFTDENDKGLSMDTNGVNKDNNVDKVNNSSFFAFKPHEEPTIPFSLSAAYKMSQKMNPQSLSSTAVSNSTVNTPGSFGPSQVHSHESFSKSSSDKESGDRIAGSQLRSQDIISTSDEHSPPLSNQQYDQGDHDQTIGVDSNAGGVVAEDGYQWRKYGQKQVKGSEFPRSYYKCTYMNCLVKKKVEMSPEGVVTEIIYKGSHNHPKPAPNRASSMAYSQYDNNHGQVVHENGDCNKGLAHSRLVLGTHDWRNGSFEQKTMSFMDPEIRRPMSSVKLQSGTLESGDAVVGSSTYSNDEGPNDSVTLGTGSISNEEGDESESKRRRIDTFATELGSGATRAIREPRVVVQARSDVDILDDGYRWRKYGQKVVKGNPNPRSYYKCTHIGCTVRKHVERASNDHMSVITTYEGKHNHDVPAARNSCPTNTPISAASTSLPQNFIPSQPPHLSSFNIPMMLPPVPPPRGFPMGMNQSNLAGFAHGQNKCLSMPAAHPNLMLEQQMNGMRFMTPKGESNLYISNASTSYRQF